MLTDEIERARAAVTAEIAVCRLRIRSGDMFYDDRKFIPDLLDTDLRELQEIDAELNKRKA